MTIPAGKTLTTSGVTNRNAYARMARIVRVGALSGWNAPVVEVAPGAKLRYMWVDGQRNQPINKKANVLSVYARMGVVGSGETVISDNKIENSPGSQTLKLGFDTMHNPSSCDTQRAERNLITAYSSFHIAGAYTGSDPWTDGIFAQCNNSIVQYNEIIDATDVGLIALRRPGQTVNADFKYNKVLQAGNSAFGGIAVDPYLEVNGVGSPSNPHSFFGTLFDGNVLWTSPNSQFEIAMSLGTRAWGLGGVGGVGQWATFQNNTSGQNDPTNYPHIYIRAAQHITINGMLSATTSGLGGNLKKVGSFGNNVCSQFATYTAHTPTYAAGNFQPGWVSANNDQCIRL